MFVWPDVSVASRHGFQAVVVVVFFMRQSVLLVALIQAFSFKDYCLVFYGPGFFFVLLDFEHDLIPSKNMSVFLRNN